MTMRRLAYARWAVGRVQMLTTSAVSRMLAHVWPTAWAERLTETSWQGLPAT